MSIFFNRQINGSFLSPRKRSHSFSMHQKFTCPINPENMYD